MNDAKPSACHQLLSAFYQKFIKVFFSQQYAQIKVQLHETLNSKLRAID